MTEDRGQALDTAREHDAAAYAAKVARYARWLRRLHQPSKRIRRCIDRLSPVVLWWWALMLASSLFTAGPYSVTRPLFECWIWLVALIIALCVLEGPAEYLAGKVARWLRRRAEGEGVDLPPMV